jgi:hypothetical protein
MWSIQATPQSEHLVVSSPARLGSRVEVWGFPHEAGSSAIRMRAIRLFPSRSTAGRFRYQSHPACLRASSGAAEVALPRSNISSDAGWTAVLVVPATTSAV